MSAATVLVTGATGAVGPALISELLAKGLQVRALVRPTSQTDLLPDAVEFVYGDITEAAAVTAAVTGCLYVFHLAAQLHVNEPTEAQRALYERVNVDGTRYVIEAAQAAGVTRVVLFSTISVYGPSQPNQIFTEESPLAGNTLYAKTKIAAEQVALSAENSQSQPLCTVLRLAAVYGPHMRGNYVLLLKAIRKGIFFPIGNGTNRRTVVYDSDVARAACLAATQPAAAGQAFNVTDGRIHQFQHILDSMYAAVGKRRRSLRLPAMPIRLALSGVASLFRVAGRKPPVTPAMLDKLLEDVAISGEKAQQQLGFSPRISLEQGWLEIGRNR